ncbi:MAG: hybrid sensor histidine kinase/response regulator, partial [Verrucomicrobia bacterium]|nr:hybrid sensor histidine kinase/response regulator [Verrucomicrobiota bacterium]
NRIIHGKLTLQRVPVDLHACVRQALEVSRGDFEAKHLELNVALEAERHQVLGEAARLRQVFWNLLKNAAKFTPARGRVTVRSRNLTDGGEPWIAVEVVDSGIGIEPAALAKIFDPFEQGNPDLGRRYGGLGLGLTIARNLVETHGGQLRAASAGPGQGATFTAELPALSHPDAPGELAPTPGAESQR